MLNFMLIIGLTFLLSGLILYASECCEKVLINLLGKRTAKNKANFPLVIILLGILISITLYANAYADVVMEWETDRVNTLMGSYFIVDVTPLNSAKVIITITQIDIPAEIPYTYFITNGYGHSTTDIIIYIPNRTAERVEKARKYIFSDSENWKEDTSLKGVFIVKRMITPPSSEYLHYIPQTGKAESISKAEFKQVEETCRQTIELINDMEKYEELKKEIEKYDEIQKGIDEHLKLQDTTTNEIETIQNQTQELIELLLREIRGK